MSFVRPSAFAVLASFAAFAITASACDPSEESNLYGSYEGPPPPVNAVPFAFPTAIAAGGNQTCILTDVGGVKCWGANEHGQLGNDSVVSTGYPNDVIGLTAGVVAISVGTFHACAITTSGGLKCWGRNDAGQLGSGTTVASHVPVDVSGLSAHVRAVSAGVNWTCALLDSGAVKCWGRGVDSVPRDLVVPTDLSGAPYVPNAISIGGSHGCVLSDSGGARCFGWNDVGQLGNGAETASSVPVHVVGLSNGVTMLAASSDGFTCALTTSGVVECWGFGIVGQLGNGRRASSDVPVAVGGVSGATAVAAGGSSACVLTGGETVECWGQNSAGELGNGTTGGAASPVDVIGVSSATDITVGQQHACAIVRGGTVKCWGSNISGQIGIHARSSAQTAIDVPLHEGALQQR